MRWIFALVLAAGCGGSEDLVGNEGFSIDCEGQACDWTVVEGTAGTGPSWHDGDPGLDLSRPGRVVVEQRSAPFELGSRELVLRAAVATDESRVRFELDWYVAGSGAGATYWDRGPVKLETRAVEVAAGVVGVEALVATPSLEVDGLVLRVVKEGDGVAIVDEISLRAPREVSR
jgi:hypothetical protein